MLACAADEVSRCRNAARRQRVTIRARRRAHRARDPLDSAKARVASYGEIADARRACRAARGWSGACSATVAGRVCRGIACCAPTAASRFRPAAAASASRCAGSPAEGVLVVRGRVDIAVHGWDRNLDAALWAPPPPGPPEGTQARAQRKALNRIARECGMRHAAPASIALESRSVRVRAARPSGAVMSIDRLMRPGLAPLAGSRRPSATGAQALSHWPDASMHDGFDGLANGPSTDTDAVALPRAGDVRSTPTDIAHLRAVGYDGWLNEQFAAHARRPQTQYLDWVADVRFRTITSATTRAWRSGRSTRSARPIRAAAAIRTTRRPISCASASRSR